MSFLGQLALDSIISELIDLAKQEKRLDKLRLAFKKKHRVLVLGSTGVGKSNLLDSLKEDLPDAIGYMNRTEVLQEHRIVLDKTLFEFIDTPGQEAHQSQRTGAVLNSGLSFIINVTAYGYHEHRQDPQKEVFDKNGEIKVGYLEDHRKIENDLLDEWAILRDGGHAPKIITVVTKADLWWKEHSWADVIQHYEKGAYYDSLGNVPYHIVLPYCSVFHKFYGIGHLSGQFDDGDRRDHRAKLLKTMLDLASVSGR